jgi:hypothetical protein
MRRFSALRPDSINATDTPNSGSSVQVSSIGGKWYVDKTWAGDTPPFGTTGAGEAGGTVPATLALTLGAPASFGAFAPGVERTYTASTTAKGSRRRAMRRSRSRRRATRPTLAARRPAPVQLQRCGVFAPGARHSVVPTGVLPRTSG